MEKKTGIDIAWEILFEEHHILEKIAADGTFSISSEAINRVKEARLMAKFDAPAQLPEIFRRHALSILPTARGQYVIGSFRTHCAVHYNDVRPRKITCPALESLDPAHLYSEAATLLFCFNSGILGDLLGSDRVQFTVSGRMGSGDFSFRIQDQRDPAKSYRIPVQNAQIEIDAGYETPEVFCLCEAKNMAAEDLLIRQLYYPYRCWEKRLRKPIVPLFLTTSNDIIHAFCYQFTDRDCYNSLKLCTHRAYTLTDETVTVADVTALWERTRPLPEPAISFPQANSFARVVDLLLALSARDLSWDEMTILYEFTPRQTDYYAAACEYLALGTRYHADGQSYLCLTDCARRILALGYRNKYLALIGQMIRFPVFHAALGLALRTGDLPSPGAAAQFIGKFRQDLGGQTIGRRAGTVRGWIGWVLCQCGELEQLTLL